MRSKFQIYGAPSSFWLGTALNLKIQTFYKNHMEKQTKIVENQRETKNPTRGKIFRPPYILPFFLPFLRQKWIEKGPDLIFLECWDSELMSLMIWQKNIFFSFQNVVKIVIFLFWGLFSLYSSPWVPRGAGGGVSHLILPFQH